MGNYTIFQMFENPRRGRQARNFATKCFENSRPQIVFRTDILPKIVVGCPWHMRPGHCTNQIPSRLSWGDLSRGDIQLAQSQPPLLEGYCALVSLTIQSERSLPLVQQFFLYTDNVVQPWSKKDSLRSTLLHTSRHTTHVCVFKLKIRAKNEPRLWLAFKTIKKSLVGNSNLCMNAMLSCKQVLLFSRTSLSNQNC